MKTQLYGAPRCIGSQAPCSSMWYGWLLRERQLARADFKCKRLNGDEKIDAPSAWIDRIPADISFFSWVKGRKDPDGSGYVYGELESDGLYHYECRYAADQDDLEWMRMTDCNYLERILKEGQLKDLEPDVYYLCQLSTMGCIGDEIAKDFDIGTWWRTQVDKPNIADLLQSAQIVYEARRVLEAKCEMLPELSKLIGEYVTVAPDKKEEEEVAIQEQKETTTPSKPSCCSMMKM